MDHDLCYEYPRSHAARKSQRSEAVSQPSSIVVGRELFRRAPSVELSQGYYIVRRVEEPSVRVVCPFASGFEGGRESEVLGYSHDRTISSCPLVPDLRELDRSLRSAEAERDFYRVGQFFVGAATFAGFSVVLALSSALLGVCSALPPLASLGASYLFGALSVEGIIAAIIFRLKQREASSRR